MTEVKYTFTINKFWEPRTLVYETTYPTPGMLVYDRLPNVVGEADLEKACGIVDHVDGQKVTIRFTDTPIGRVVKEHAEQFGKKSLYLTVIGVADEELFFPKHLCLIRML